MNLQKAFDIVDHTNLIKNLSTFCIGPHAFGWFLTYSNYRKLPVRHNCHVLNLANIMGGVPQGSIFDPLLLCISMTSVNI